MLSSSSSSELLLCDAESGLLPVRIATLFKIAILEFSRIATLGKIATFFRIAALVLDRIATLLTVSRKALHNWLIELTVQSLPCNEELSY